MIQGRRSIGFKFSFIKNWTGFGVPLSSIKLNKGHSVMIIMHLLKVAEGNLATSIYFAFWSIREYKMRHLPEGALSSKMFGYFC